ncbi:MAG: glycosyltransferase family 39 protein [Patescibacteria group bacterium]
MEKNRFRKIDVVILGCILAVALIFRLYKVTAPLSDAYSWRQADTAAVARNFARNGFTLFEPHYDDLSSIQSGSENPTGLRFVEFPIYNAMFAGLYSLLPFVPIEAYGRLVTIFFSLLVIAIIYYLLLKEHSRLSAFMGAMIYSVFPAFVFFSRVVLPETTAVAFSFMAILFLYWWQNQKKSHFALMLFGLSTLCFALSILIKPTVIFYGIVLLYIFISKYKFGLLKKFDFYFYFFLAALPFILWRLYIDKFPEGIPSSDWLITSVNTFEGQKVIFMRPAFFRWVFYERINLMIFGGYMTAFFVAGIFTKLKKYFIHTIFLGALAYLFVFQGGNVQHEYYQTVIFPPLAMFAGIGIALFMKDRKNFIHPIIIYPAVVVLAALSIMFSYYYKVKDFYTYPEDLNQMAKILDTFTRPNDKVITDRLGDTTLLYLADRRGAPMLYKTIEQLKTDGYTYYMTDKKEIIEDLKTKKQYPVLFENSQFVLFKL